MLSALDPYFHEKEKTDYKLFPASFEKGEADLGMKRKGIF